ncbi:VRR-NUC domain-containing protein [Pedobacter panaciterrae]|uniref:VRR-NUC domain-containing protein n=1 Tax=Pedobacter panaciterrae TaxID=363849 RepID=A0ABU8NTW9_9SPHI
MENHKSEAEMQAEIFQYFWNEYPKTRRLLFHVPNGGSRNKIEAVRLRAQGVVKGVTDFILLGLNGMVGIELKIPGGIISDDQQKIHSAWIKQGYKVCVCWSKEEAISIIKQELGL